MKKFIITCAARSGSTMLRHALNDHPEVVCQGEIFKLKQRFKFWQKLELTNFDGPLVSQDLYKRDSDAFLSKYIFNSSKETIKACGFKYKLDEYYLNAFSKISNYIKNDHSIGVIRLRRKDLLAQYISKRLVQIQKGPTFTMEDSTRSRYKTFEINIGNLERYLVETKTREDDIMTQLKAHSIHSVWYEDLIDNRNLYLKQIFNFLNVDDAFEIEYRTKKLVANHYDLIKNSETVFNFMSNSEFSNRFNSNKETNLG